MAVLVSTPSSIPNEVPITDSVADTRDGSGPTTASGHTFVVTLRYPNVRLVSCNPWIKASNQDYVVSQTSDASLGRKQTKCGITDETVHVGWDDSVWTITRTRTLEVPSGDVFSVKTRTSVMWASPVSPRVVVTTQITQS